MTFRTRLLAGFGVAVLVPLAVFGLGIRRELSRRLTATSEARVAALVSAIHADLDRESESVAHRLGALKVALGADNRFRAAALQGSDRAYVLDYAGVAMRLAGLDFLHIVDEEGRVVSSGHFRNEYDQVVTVPQGTSLMRARAAEAPFLALVRPDSLRLSGRTLLIVGGIRVDSAFLARVTTADLTVAVRLPSDSATSPPDSSGTIVGELTLPFLDAEAGGAATAGQARVVVTHTTDLLDTLRNGLNVWFAGAALVTLLVALLLASWLSTRISRPLTALAEKTAAIELDRLDVVFESGRSDEVGALSRLLGAMTERLKAGAVRLREMERRVAMGDLARQVNHDVKNGLAPLRNVLRHLAQVAQETPDRLPTVFAERQGTLESSIAYLENLAANYARLYPPSDRRPTDVNAVVRETLRHVSATDVAELKTELPDGLPPVRADALVLRRVIENLIGNAVDSLEGKPGTVTVATSWKGRKVRIAVGDTGRGMTQPELDKAFDDFYTTKTGGTGLGLSIVRRLVLDSDGALNVETEPGKGSTFTVELPTLA